MFKGSQPTDGGHLILTQAARDDLLRDEPAAEDWLRPYFGGDELVNGEHRWCLWLKDASPAQLRRLPLVRGRLENISATRLKSATTSVRAFANQPSVFTQDRQPDVAYLAVPEVTSENRRFIPMAFLGPEIVASNKLQIVPGATLFHFGVLTSTMHMAWMRAVSGRLKSDYSYAPAVYNNFPWPNPTPARRAAIEHKAQAVLDARAAHADATLADLYDRATMPADLSRAHAARDRAVDAAYGSPKGGWVREADRVAFLFRLYQALAAPMDVPAAPPGKRRRTTR